MTGSLEPKLIRISEAAHLMGLTENAVRYKIRQGYLSGYKNQQGKIRVDENEVINKCLTYQKQ